VSLRKARGWRDLRIWRAETTQGTDGNGHQPGATRVAQLLPGWHQCSREMPGFFIFFYNVERFIPRRAAAPISRLSFATRLAATYSCGDPSRWAGTSAAVGGEDGAALLLWQVRQRDGLGGQPAALVPQVRGRLQAGRDGAPATGGADAARGAGAPAARPPPRLAA